MRFTFLTIFFVTFSIFFLSAQEQGNVIKFDGDADFVTVPHSEALNVSSHWTLEAWVKPDTITNAYQAILSKNWGPRPASLWIRNGFAEIWFSVDNADGGKLQGTVPFKANEWTHLAATYDSTQLFLYVNGELDVSVALSVKPDVNENDWTFGQRGDNSSWFSGEMDEVRIWDIARTEEQIDYYKDFILRSDVDGLQGLWHFNDAVGSGRAWEETANNNHGIISGAQIINSDSPVDQLPANALYLDGVNDYVTIPHNAALEISTNWTLETWIKPDTITSGYKALISKNWSPRPPSLWIFNKRIEVWFEADSTGDIAQAEGHSILVPGTWQHIAATYDGSFIKIFVNGKLDTMVANNLEPKLNTSDWTLGQRGDNLYWFGGYMDETRIWDRALGQEEIQQKMLNTHSPETGLLASWGYNQLSVGEFATIFDNSGNKFDGITGGQNLVDSDTPVSNVLITALEPLQNIVRPTKFTLEQNYPNPFNPSTTIPFNITKQGRVSLKIYDTVGRKVLDVFNKTVDAGSYAFTVDMSALPSGTYFYQLKTASSIQTKRMLLIK